jgi:nucleoside-diphosphate-sugar epimerase
VGWSVRCGDPGDADTDVNVVVTGATGFVGRHVVKALTDRSHSVIAVARNAERAKALAWPAAVRFLQCDVHQPDLDIRNMWGPADAVIHLAWPGLPNYANLTHFEQTLLADYRFLKSVITAGYTHLLVTGTCFEYGMQSGPLDEGMETKPSNPYGLAKDTLRRFLEALRVKHPFTLQWARLFYMFGPGQNPGSLLAQLERALERGDEEFPMSGGEQLRDYMPVEQVAAALVRLIEHPECDGIVNICSGKPVSVRNLVETFVASKGKQIRLKLGHYAYPDYEPMAFWGVRSRCRESEVDL